MQSVLRRIASADWRIQERVQRSVSVPVAALIVCVGAALASGCAMQQTSATPSVPESVPYRIGPSDELVIRVLPDPAIEREVIVQPDGSFAFDLIGEVKASRRTPAEVAAEIEERIAEYRVSPSVTVSLNRAASSSVTVIGEVKAPGMYPVERDLRITDAIARAGGETLYAAASRARLIRREGGEQATTYVSNLDRIHGGKLETDYVVLRGDLIFVPPAATVEVGYHMMRILYPLEVLARILLAPFTGLLGP
jgi:polysaccharide export outer membrane protein